MDLEGKVALVLGAIRGIGKAIGLSLAEHGVRVALNYFDWEEELEGLEQDFADTGQPHLILKTNLIEVEKIADLVQRVVDRFGRLVLGLGGLGRATVANRQSSVHPGGVDFVHVFLERPGNAHPVHWELHDRLAQEASGYGSRT